MRPEQVVITAGTQQAVDIVIRILPDMDKEVWVEDPGYSLTRLAPGRGGREGPPDTGRPARHRCRRRHLGAESACRFHNALAPISEGRRPVDGAPPRTSRLGAESGAWIVEDDYASEFRYGGRPLASLQGLDEAERVIYVGTLNKALFPGLRLGYAVVPPALVRAFVAARYLMDRQPSTISQASSPPSWSKDILQRTSAACA